MPPSIEHTDDDALNVALAILNEPLPGSDAFVSYKVRSSLLLVGSTEPVLEMARSLRHQFDVVAVINGPRPESRLLGVSIVVAQQVSLSGHLGQFIATALDEDSRPVDLARKSSNDDGCFDLVLDFSQTPILDYPILPLGYLRPSDPGQREEMLDALPALSGEVRKPKYFNLEADRCAHRLQQVSGCDRCLDVCPAGAISSGQQSITVDAFLCRGCGTCAAVCPTGALTYADPPLMTVIERIERLLQVFRDAGGSRPWIGFYTDDDAALKEWAFAQKITLLPFGVRSVSSLGLEAWLAAISLGAEGVALSISESTPVMVVDTLKIQIELTQRILGGLGYGQKLIFMLHGDRVDSSLVVSPSPADLVSNQMWSYPTTNSDPRSRLLLLFDRLSSGSQQLPEKNSIKLPALSTFGGVKIDNDTCTMCMACASLCPPGALRVDHDGAELCFMEAACIQCGLCEHGCPEDAITRRPRFDYQSLSSSDMVTLNQAQMANCKQCGQSFMSTALLAAVLKRLTGDSAEIQHAKQMLLVCPQCRADSALKAQLPIIPGSSK